MSMELFERELMASAKQQLCRYPTVYLRLYRRAYHSPV